jgi:hypothetical protein
MTLPIEAQSTQQSTKPLFANCWQQGVIKTQRSCVAHLYLNNVALLLEIMRKPEPKPSVTNEASVQAMLSDLIYRQQQKARAYRNTCNDLRNATIGGDSIAQTTTSLICGALENQERADSMTMAALFADIEGGQRSLVEKAKQSADAASATKEASRIMYTSAAALTYMLLELDSGDKPTLLMSKAERNALIAKTLSLYKGAKVQNAKYVLEQNVEVIRDFLQDNWKDLDDLKRTRSR